MAVRVLLLGAAAALFILLPAGGSSVMPGGIAPVDATSPEVLQAVHAAVEHFNRRSNETFLSKMRRVLNAKEQVVTGMLYHLRVKLGTTNCRKTAPNIDLESCQFHPSPALAKTRICKFQIWDRPWMGPMQVTLQNCRIV
ncbi:cystatin-like [Mustelus asterias]